MPGRVADKYSTGTNNLIATHRALLVRNADDIAYQMGWPLTSRQSADDSQQQLFATLNKEEQHVLDLLHDHQQLTLEELASLTDMSMPRMAALMFNLEMQKAVRVLPGHLYQPLLL